MSFGPGYRLGALLLCVGLAAATDVRAQGTSSDARWAIDVGVGIDPTINGNINSGAIGTLQGLSLIHI